MRPCRWPRGTPMMAIGARRIANLRTTGRDRVAIREDVPAGTSAEGVGDGGPQAGVQVAGAAAVGRHLDDPDARAGAAGASSVRRSSSEVDPGVRRAGRGAQRRPRSTPCGVPKTRSKDVRVLRPALLELGEQPAAVVVHHDDRQVGPRLVRARSPGRCCRAGTSGPPSGRTPGRRAPGRHRSRWTPCRRCRRRRGSRAPAARRLPRVGEVEVADRARRPGDEQPIDRH